MISSHEDTEQHNIELAVETIRQKIKSLQNEKPTAIKTIDWLTEEDIHDKDQFLKLIITSESVLQSVQDKMEKISDKLEKDKIEIRASKRSNLFMMLNNHSFIKQFINLIPTDTTATDGKGETKKAPADKKPQKRKTGTIEVDFKKLQDGFPLYFRNVSKLYEEHKIVRLYPFFETFASKYRLEETDLRSLFEAKKSVKRADKECYSDHILTSILQDVPHFDDEHADINEFKVDSTFLQTWVELCVQECQTVAVKPRNIDDCWNYTFTHLYGSDLKQRCNYQAMIWYNRNDCGVTVANCVDCLTTILTKIQSLKRRNPHVVIMPIADENSQYLFVLHLQRNKPSVSGDDSITASAATLRSSTQSSTVVRRKLMNFLKDQNIFLDITTRNNSFQNNNLSLIRDFCGDVLHAITGARTSIDDEKCIQIGHKIRFFEHSDAHTVILRMKEIMAAKDEPNLKVSQDLNSLKLTEDWLTVCAQASADSVGLQVHEDDFFFFVNPGKNKICAFYTKMLDSNQKVKNQFETKLVSAVAMAERDIPLDIVIVIFYENAELSLLKISYDNSDNVKVTGWGIHESDRDKITHILEDKIRKDITFESKPLERNHDCYEKIFELFCSHEILEKDKRVLLELIPKEK